MAKSATKKPSNVVPLKATNPNVFHIEGDVMPTGSKNPKDRVSFSADLDFTGVDIKDIHRMAAQTIVIKLAGNCRSKFAAGYDAKAKKHEKPFNVVVRETIPAKINVQADIVSKLRSTSSANRVEKMAANIDKLSDDQKAKLKKLLGL